MKFENRSIIFDDFLVVADLHLGFEKSIEDEGFNIPSQTMNILKEIIKLRGRCNKLLINGDVKHNIPGISWKEYRELPDFFRELGKNFKEIVICKGNHDGRIERIVDCDVKNEYTIKNVGFTHGHRLPSREMVKKVDLIVMAHTHPTFRFIDPIRRIRKKPCWVIGKPKRTFKSKFGSIVEKIIVQPAFNKFFSGSSKEYFGVFQKYAKIEEIILTDMTKVV